MNNPEINEINEKDSELHKINEERGEKAEAAANILLIGTEVMNGKYKVSSIGYRTKEEAYEEIKNSWSGVEGVTTYFHQANDSDPGYWYIIAPISE